MIPVKKAHTHTHEYIYIYAYSYINSSRKMRLISILVSNIQTI